jgi:hypothetical protein
MNHPGRDRGSAHATLTYVPPPRRHRPASWVAVVSLVVGIVLTGGLGRYLFVTRTPAPSNAVDTPTETPFMTVLTTPWASVTTRLAPTAERTYAARGPGTYAFAKGQSAVFGTAGTLKTYRVAIETGTPVPIEEFAQRVDQILSDERSWIAGKSIRLQRVSDSSPSFTVYLVTPGTAQTLCLNGGFDIFWRGEPYTSCRVGGRVLINIARWLKGIPDYGAPIDTYQEYAINHEVGHALRHGHELCPKKGDLSPVMAQQTFGLYGCRAYSWPYLGGTRYAGPPGRIVPSN